MAIHLYTFSETKIRSLHWRKSMETHGYWLLNNGTVNWSVKCETESGKLRPEENQGRGWGFWCRGPWAPLSCRRWWGRVDRGMRRGIGSSSETSWWHPCRGAWAPSWKGWAEPGAWRRTPRTSSSRRQASWGGSALRGPDSWRPTAHPSPVAPFSLSRGNGSHGLAPGRRRESDKFTLVWSIRTLRHTENIFLLPGPMKMFFIEIGKLNFYPKYCWKWHNSPQCFCNFCFSLSRGRAHESRHGLGNDGEVGALMGLKQVW